MEAVRVFISLPFRIECLPGEHPGCLKRFDARQINRYLAALKREICSVAEESGDLLVQEIVIGNGSISHLTADDLTLLVSEVSHWFHVSHGRKLTLTATPAGFDFYKLNAIRQMGNAHICFEIPALTDKGLSEGGYVSSSRETLAALDCCFQNGFHEHSVFLTAQDMDPEEARDTVERILLFHPEGILFRYDAEETLLSVAESVLESAGWIKAGYHWYSRAVPQSLYCPVQIGCGPGAISVFDGVRVHSTTDFDYYCSHSEDFEALVKRAESDPA